MTQTIQSKTFGASRRPFIAGLMKTWHQRRQARLREQSLLSLRAEANRLVESSSSYASDLYATADRYETHTLRAANC